MKLKSIEMQGFKSFPDKTVMDFGKGVTCIIGPNGSGKSNISDAVRWVLGEMKMKSLRGNKMDDVIFNGAGDRPQGNCASVSLVLDTEEEYIAAQSGLTELLEDDASTDDKNKKTFRISQFREVAVTRKYYRSGESEYYINKQQVRLRDVYEMFYDTGIGREGYSIIEQGKISEILSQKADERRTVFEEAAGISRFRVRKEEAERRLERVRGNLERATDILNEVASQLEPLHKQADDARQYISLGNERRGIELTLWLNKIDALRIRRGECASTLSASKLELDRAEECALSLEKQLDELLEGAQNFSRMAGEAEIEKSEAERQRASLASRLAVCRTEIEHLNENIASLEKAAETANEDIAYVETLVTDACGALSVLEKELAEAQTKSESARAEYDARSACVSALSEKELKLNEEYTASIEELGGISTAAAALDAELESTAKNAAESDSRIAASEKRRDELAAECEAAESAHSCVREKLEQLYAKRDETERKIKQKQSELESVRAEETAERISLTAEEQRREHIRRLESLLTGYSDGVKTVIGSASGGKILKNGKKVDVRGLVSTLLSAGGEYVQALETALQSSVQFIVVGDEEDARACIAYLKSVGGGKATFLPLTSVRGRRSDVSAIKHMDGFVGIAADKAEFAPEYAGIANELLGRTVIAENLEKAAAMARALHYSVRFVTLDGQMINAGGSYTGGSVTGKTGLFTRARDLEMLSASIRSRNEKLFGFGRTIRVLTNDIDALNQSVAGLDDDIGQLKADADEMAAGLSAVRARYDEEAMHLQALIQHKASGDSDASDIKQRISLLARQKGEATLRSEGLKQRLTELRSETDAAKQSAFAAYEVSGVALQHLFERRNAFDAQKRAVDALRDRAASSKKRLDEAVNGKAETEKALQAKTAEAAELDMQTKQAQSQADYAGSRMASLLRQREAAEADTNKIRLSLKSAQSGKDEAFRTYSMHENALQRIDEEIELISAKMWDGYELTYSAAEQYRLPEDQMKGAQTRLNTIIKRIRSMGPINLAAVEQYAEVKQRHDFLSAQIDDLNKSRRGLDATITKLESAMKETFVATLANINTAFDEVFRRLFGGGGACVELTDPDDPLESGLDINLRIPGKKVRSISLLSGGEQSFAAVALYLALQKINPSPFCIFDEIESALDDINLSKLADYVHEESDRTQYIMITHRRGTMERADTLYGVTMPKKGISTYLKLDLAKMDEHIKRYV